MSKNTYTIKKDPYNSEFLLAEKHSETETTEIGWQLNTPQGKEILKSIIKKYKEIDALTSGKNKPNKKRKFTVSVCRTSYQFTDIEVEADSQEEANELALDEAGGHTYSEKSAEYSLAN